MFIQTSLDQLKTILTPVCDANNTDCVLFSETQEQRGKAWLQNMLIIHFAGANFSPPSGSSKLSQSDCSPIQQIVTYDFNLVLYHKILRNDRNNAYKTLEEIVTAVNGERLVTAAGLFTVSGITYRSYEDSRFYLYGVNGGFDFKQSFDRCC